MDTFWMILILIVGLAIAPFFLVLLNRIYGPYAEWVFKTFDRRTDDFSISTIRGTDNGYDKEDIGKFVNSQ